jgi:hypothetical protein
MLAAIPSVSHEFLPLVLERHAARYPGVEEVRTIHQYQMAPLMTRRGLRAGYYEHLHRSYQPNAGERAAVPP